MVVRQASRGRLGSGACRGGGVRNGAMDSQERRADEPRIGDRVVSSESRILTVTSTRMQGVGAGAVSLGFAELPHRISYRPSDSVLVVAPSIRKAG